jgi:peroxidase
MDLIAIDIQREKDVGIATLNQTRKALGMKTYASFAALTPDPVLQSNLKTVYGSIDQVDLFIGGLAESHAQGALVGPTFQAIIADQFQALRAGDRFFWQNEGFNQATTSWIANTTLSSIMLRNTDTISLQANVFIESPLPHHVKAHVAVPAVINGQGRDNPVVNGGT